MGGNKLVDVEDFLMDDMCGFKGDDVRELSLVERSLTIWRMRVIREHQV